MIISKINRNKQVQTWFFQNKSEQNCNVHTIHRFSAGLAGRTAGRQPDQAKHSRPAIKGKLPASLPLSKFFFQTKFLQKVRLDQNWKLSKIVTYVVVSTMSDIFFRYLVDLVRFHEIFLVVFDLSCTQRLACQKNECQAALIAKPRRKFEKHRPALSTLHSDLYWAKVSK